MKPASPWLNQAVVQTLTDLWATHSATEIAAKIFAIHEVKLTRMSVIGRVRRMGLTCENKVSIRVPKARKPKIIKAAKRGPVEHRTTFRISKTNGNSGSLRMVFSTESDLPPLRCVEIEPLNISLLDLEAHHCRQPYGDIEKGEAITFCGHPKKEGSSYCVPHAALNYKKLEPIAPKSRHYYGTDFARGAA